MAEAAVSFVVERLGELLMEKASSLRSVRDNIQRLQTELKWMQCFLKDADGWQHHDNRIIQNLVAEIRDLACDAEDVIESHALAAESTREEGGFGIIRALSRTNKSLEVASQIDEFTSKINELGGRLQIYGIREVTGSGTHQNLQLLRRRSYPHLAEQNVIGLGEDAEKIATQLIDETLRSRAVSICGMGGIGKTTLAKKVYHNRRVRSHFSCFAWAYVSQQCQIRDIWEGILINLSSPSGRKRRHISELKDDEIAMELYQLLMKKKCLVVLDDIWTKEAWDCLCAGFPLADTESKILLTTRNKRVALHVDPDCLIHSSRCLNESQSWELFLRVAIRHREEGFTFNENLEALGRSIVNRCGGLPLAIKTLGGILRDKSSLHDWTMVYNTMLSHLGGIDNVITELELTSLLALSYHDLPYQLKQCFLHFSPFPEGFIIPASTIINIWVAEGIIPKESRGEETRVEMEDIAYSYLEDLISRCMLQIEKWSSTGRIKSCRLHDLMRDLCIQEAKKENFFHAEYLEHGNDEASPSSTLIQSASTSKPRRLALYLKNSRPEPRLNYDKYAHVRSLLVFSVLSHYIPILIDDSHLAAMARHFKYLRILCLEAAMIDEEIPEQIGDLVHLRLLDIGSSWTFQLPSSLGKLTRLLTLKLDRIDLSRKGSAAPNIVENMHQLRHLYFPRSMYFLFRRFGFLKLSHLRDLQTLVNLPLLYVKTEELIGLPSLKKLKLSATDDDEFNCLVEMLNSAPSTKFNKLHSLSMRFGRWRGGGTAIEITKVASLCPKLQKLKLAGPLVLDLPDGSQIFQHLNKLTLEHSNLAEDPMPALGKLPNLRVLRLHSALGKDAIMFPNNSFPCLQSLVLSQEEHLKEWIIEEGALPCLSFLKLYFCINLKTVPEGLRFLCSLQELQIVDMPLAFTERIHRGGRRFPPSRECPITAGRDKPSGFRQQNNLLGCWRWCWLLLSTRSCLNHSASISWEFRGELLYV